MKPGANVASPVSGTGSYAAQLAKRVFNAGKVITTVSTSKIDKVPEYLGEGVIDQSQSQRLPLFRSLPLIISSI